MRARLGKVARPLLSLGGGAAAREGLRQEAPRSRRRGGTFPGLQRRLPGHLQLPGPPVLREARLRGRRQHPGLSPGPLLPRADEEAVRGRGLQHLRRLVCEAAPGSLSLFALRGCVLRPDQARPAALRPSSRTTSSAYSTSSGVVRKLTKHARRQARPSTEAGARKTRPSRCKARASARLCASRSSTPVGTCLKQTVASIGSWRTSTSGDSRDISVKDRALSRVR